MINKAESQDVFGKQILENLSIAILLFDQDLNLRHMNSAAEILFAVSARHMVYQKAGDLIQCDSGLEEEVLRRALTTGQPFTEREVALRLPNGETVTVVCTAIPIVDRENGDYLMMEIQHIDRQLQISREEHLINQHDAARDLIRGLAHEIKNPLGGLRGAAQLLEDELDAPALREYTQIIIDEADRLQALVNQMLGSNRLPEMSEVNVHKILERVRSLMVAEYGNSIRIERDFDPSIPELYVDSDRIIQAILNIGRNAAQAVGNKGDGEVLMRTRIMRQFTIGNVLHRLVVLIEIEDNGPGIPEEIREKIFYPMVTSGGGGMGLGLSITQSLIHQHGGLVEFTSAVGKTVFRVLLPLEKKGG
jgi:two-component system, NtrC family, nitrogen regulation sensor histidine kinase GlnL